MNESSELAVGEEVEGGFAAETEDGNKYGVMSDKAVRLAVVDSIIPLRLVQ